MIGHPEPPPGKKGVDIIHLMNHSAGYRKGDLVLVKFGKLILKGKVITTLWKSDGEWIVVEAEYEDLAGKTHTGKMKPMRRHQIARRLEHCESEGEPGGTEQKADR